MNYNHKLHDEFIQNIIDTRGQGNIPEGEYGEGHHIIPVCLGGTGRHRSKHKNIIGLYPEEHYKAHKLLAEENPTNIPLQRAGFRISHNNTINIPAEEYALSRLNFIASISGENHYDCSGSNNPMYNVHRYGLENPNYNKKGTEEQKLNQSKRLQGTHINDKRLRYVLCIDTGKVFLGLKEAAKYVNGNNCKLCAAIKNNIRYKKYFWKYVD